MSIDDLQLIETINAHECLYNTKINDYKNVSKRKAAWQEISAKFGATIPDCKARWKELRCSFLNAITRRDSTSTKLYRKWKYENEMSFLLPFMSRSPWNRLSNYNTEDYNQGDNCSVSQYSDECSNEETKAGRGIKRKHQHLEDIIQEKRQCVDEYSNDCNETEKTDYYNEILQLVKDKVKNKKERKDEIDLLFESLAKAVKLLPKSEQIELKVGITSLVYEAQLKHGN